MYVNLYAIFDYKVETYQCFFTQQHDVQAERIFRDVVLDKDTIIGRNPKDFALVRLGKINKDTGNVTPEEPAPMFLRTADQYAKEVDDDD